jgi:hypothetical protein
MERRESSVVPKLRLPTKMFFIQVLFLEVAEQLIAARIEQRAANRTVRDFAKIGVTDKRQPHSGTSGARKQPFPEALPGSGEWTAAEGTRRRRAGV